MTAIDHAAEADRFAAWADNPALPPENVAAIASLAQAHATLALVEQQRIANLLALAQYEWRQGSVRRITKEEYAVRLRDEASALLRLKEEA